MNPPKQPAAPKPQPIRPSPMNPGTRGTGPASVKSPGPSR
jgi:hypothetical protein